MSGLNNKSKVAIVRGTNPRAMVNKAITLIGGMRQFVKPGDIVLIKPNLLSAAPPGKVPNEINTDNRVITPLVELAVEAGPKRVIVGNGLRGGINARSVFKAIGVDEAVKKVGGEISYFDEEPVITVDIPGGRLLRRVKVPNGS